MDTDAALVADAGAFIRGRLVLSTIRAVLLDLDDTLVPDGGAFLTAAAALADDLGAPPELATAVRRAARAAWRSGPHFAWFQTIGVSSWKACGHRLAAPAARCRRSRSGLPGTGGAPGRRRWSSAASTPHWPTEPPTASSTTAAPPAPRTPSSPPALARGFGTPVRRRSS